MGDSRRTQRRSFLLGLPALGAAACAKNEEFTCTDASGLTPQQMLAREKLVYADRTSNVARLCLECRFYVAPPQTGCGTCTVVPGPVHAQGTCNIFQAKT